MNWKERARDARALAESLDEHVNIPFEELGELGIVIVTLGANPGPSVKELVRSALHERAEVYEALHAYGNGTP